MPRPARSKRPTAKRGKPKPKPKTKPTRSRRPRPEDFQGEAAPLWADLPGRDGEARLVPANSAAARRAAERAPKPAVAPKTSTVEVTRARLRCPVCRGEDFRGPFAASAKLDRRGNFRRPLERACTSCGLLLVFARPGRVALD